VDEKNLREYSVFHLTGVIVTTNYRANGLFFPQDDRRHYVAWSDLRREKFLAHLLGGSVAGVRQRRGRACGGIPRDPGLARLRPEDSTAEDAGILGHRRCTSSPGGQLSWLTHGQSCPRRLGDIAGVAAHTLKEWLQDRRSYRQIPHRLEAAGYVPVRNANAKDGLWRFAGRRQATYARHDLPERERLMAAQERCTSTT
jgi:hypothetical protein